MHATHRTSVVVVDLFAISVNLQLVLTTMAAMLLMLGSAQSPPSPPSPPLLSALVPKINTDNVQLTPDGNRYYLRIKTDGSTRYETVELRAPGTPAQELHVQGSLTVNYVPGLELFLMYEAGKDGYAAKYKYALKKPLPQSYFSVALLKSSAG